MSHVPYVALGNHLLDLSFTTVAMWITVKVLFRTKTAVIKTSNISPTITVFYWYIFLRSLWSFINFAYLLGWFRLNTILYDARVLYILGMFPGIFVTTNSLVELFLCLDRCLYIIFPLQYSKSHLVPVIVKFDSFNSRALNEQDMEHGDTIFLIRISMDFEREALICQKQCSGVGRGEFEWTRVRTAP